MPLAVKLIHGVTVTGVKRDMNSVPWYAPTPVHWLFDTKNDLSQTVSEDPI